MTLGVENLTQDEGVKRQVMIDAPPGASYSAICMRVLLAGLLLLCLTGAAFAQDAAGEVESIGYGGAYRPNCWVPMKLPSGMLPPLWKPELKSTLKSACAELASAPSATAMTRY